MNLDTLGNLGDFIGGFAVIVSVIYLARQIRQNTGMLRASALSATTDTYVAFNHLLGSDPAAARVFQVGLENFASLSENEQRQFLNLMRAAIISYEHVYQNYAAGLIDLEVWDRYQREAKRLLQIPHIDTWWNARKHAYTQSFVEAMEETAAVPARKLANEIIAEMAEAQSPSNANPDSIPPGHGRP
jgi:hypothetical protein